MATATVSRSIRWRRFNAVIRQERQTSQLSSFILVVGDMADAWLPCGAATCVARKLVHRRAVRRAAQAKQ